MNDTKLSHSTFVPDGGPAPAIKMLRFATDSFSDGQRVEAYREIFGRTIVKHDIEPLGNQPFHFDASLCSLPGLGLATSLITPCRRMHRPEHIESDDFRLGISVAGELILEQCGQRTIVRQGEAALMSNAYPGEVTGASTSRLISLRIPQSVLKDVDKRMPLLIPQTNEGLRLLSSYVGFLRDAEVLTNPKLSDIIVTHIYDLVQLAAGARGETLLLAEQRGGSAARRAAILRAIKTCSSDPSLSPDAVAKSLGITSRYVHLLLEETGKSFSHHLLETRLEKTAALLTDQRWRDRNISEIAYEAGFTDLSHFSRAFRRHYGATPSEMRKAHEGRF